MQEILIPKALIAVFLLVSIIRPFIRELSAIKGLNLLPALAFFTCIVLLPAYGFRPELVPIFIFSLLITLTTASRRKRKVFSSRAAANSSLFSLLARMVLLIFSAWVMFAFTPRTETALVTSGVYSLREGGFNIRVYVENEHAQNGYLDDELLPPENQTLVRPLLALLPPVVGSFASADVVAAELRDRGFTVIVMDRSRMSPARWLGGVRAFLAGTRAPATNPAGRRLEQERKAEARFLLSWIGRNPQINAHERLFDAASASAVFLGGFCSAGSAIFLLQDSLFRDAYEQGIAIQGFVAIESRLWSVSGESDTFEETLQMPAAPAVVQFDEGLDSSRSPFGAFWNNITARFSQIQFRRHGFAPAETLVLSKPTLFLVSGTAEEESRENRYQAIFQTFRAAEGFAVLASSVFGSLYYSDFQARYPLIVALFSGSPSRRELLDRRDRANAQAQTAAVIAYFAEEVLNSLNMPSTLRGQEVPPAFSVESRNALIIFQNEYEFESF